MGIIILFQIRICRSPNLHALHLSRREDTPLVTPILPVTWSSIVTRNTAPMLLPSASASKMLTELRLQAPPLPLVEESLPLSSSVSFAASAVASPSSIWPSKSLSKQLLSSLEEEVVPLLLPLPKQAVKSKCPTRSESPDDTMKARKLA